MNTIHKKRQLIVLFNKNFSKVLEEVSQEFEEFLKLTSI
jgi:hypothetical protein